MLRIIASVFLAASLAFPNFASGAWLKLDSGMELGQFKIQAYSPVGDSIITVLRIDPQLWELKLLSLTGTTEKAGMTTREWSSKHLLTAAINAGMFNADYRTHTGFMACEHDVNNSTVNEYRSAAAFGPTRPEIPPYRLHDLESTTIPALRNDYSCLVQNLRLIDRSRKNRWSQQPKMWSEAALGEDRAGRILFIFCRSPYSMHDLNEILLSLPIDLVCAQHLEGGPEAQLYVHSGSTELELAGSYETSFFESDGNSQAQPVPNVLAIVKRPH